VIGSGVAQEHSVAGETPNLAARLQALAEPGSVLICQTTHDQVVGLFDCQGRGAVVIKGFSRPIPVWRVVQERVLASRFEARHAARLSPLVGRDEELAMLFRRWQQIKGGDGRVVLLSGEAGIGKSRLIAELIEHLSDDDHLRARYFCSPHHSDSALYPIIGQIARQGGFARSDSAQERSAKLAAVLAPMQPSEEELALFCELMSVPQLGLPVPLGFSPQRKKEKTFAALCRRLECLAATRPLFIILEDAHWADATTGELFGVMHERLRRLPVLLIMTFRPEFAAPWVGQAGVTLIALNRLGQRESAALAGHVDGAEMLPRDQLDWIVAQSDGVPLFIEELTKSVVEGAVDALRGGSAPAVPRSLESSLLARLDRIPGAKQVAQIGAVIGREFGYELIAAVAPLHESALIDGLDRLVAAGLLFARGRPGEAVYRFKHALVRDAAYESLLRRSRGAIHAKIVEALKQLVPEVEATQPEALAHHCAQAGLVEQAADYYRRAGELSIARSAIAEARTHLERGLALANSLPESAARFAQEAGLLLALGSVAMINEGYGAAGLAARMENAVALARRADWRPLLIRALRGELDYKMHTGDLAGALGVAQEMMELAARENDPIARIVAATSLGINYAYVGRLAEARDLFERALCEPAISASTSFGSPHPQDYEVLARTYLSTTLARLGLATQAAAEASRAIERARQLKHHPSLATALTMGCRQAWLMRDERLVEERATELTALAGEQGFPYWLARAVLCRMGCNRRRSRGRWLGAVERGPVPSREHRGRDGKLRRFGRRRLRPRGPSHGSVAVRRGGSARVCEDRRSIDGCRTVPIERRDPRCPADHGPQIGGDASSARTRHRTKPKRQIVGAAHCN
jgi:tetratricopeptide (TPR) repeat protein